MGVARGNPRKETHLRAEHRLRGAEPTAQPRANTGRIHYTSHLATSRPNTEASLAPKAPPPDKRPTRSSPPRRRAADVRTTPRATTARAPLLVRGPRRHGRPDLLHVLELGAEGLVDRTPDGLVGALKNK